VRYCNAEGILGGMGRRLWSRLRQKQYDSLKLSFQDVEASSFLIMQRDIVNMLMMRGGFPK